MSEDVELVQTDKPPEANGPPSTMLMVHVGLDPTTGGCGIFRDEEEVKTWEMVIAILSAGLAFANFNRNMGHGAMMQNQAKKAIETQMLAQQLQKKGLRA